jgi:hypothetical protein
MIKIVLFVCLLVGLVVSFSGTVTEPNTGVEVPSIMRNGKELLRNFKIDSMGVGVDPAGWLGWASKIASFLPCAGAWYKAENPKSNSMAFVLKQKHSIASSWITNEEQSFFGELFDGYEEGELFREQMHAAFQSFPRDLESGKSLKFVYSDPDDTFTVYHENKVIFPKSNCKNTPVHAKKGQKFGTRNGAIPNICSVAIEYMKDNAKKYIRS